jgi:hypothetical protein
MADKMKKVDVKWILSIVLRIISEILTEKPKAENNKVLEDKTFP